VEENTRAIDDLLKEENNCLSQLQQLQASWKQTQNDPHAKAIHEQILQSAQKITSLFSQSEKYEQENDFLTTELENLTDSSFIEQKKAEAENSSDLTEHQARIGDLERTWQEKAKELQELKEKIKKINEVKLVDQRQLAEK
jgi:predicted RNase H-like nuclease (RuvC/YqgF family)